MFKENMNSTQKALVNFCAIKPTAYTLLFSPRIIKHIVSTNSKSHIKMKKSTEGSRTYEDFEPTTSWQQDAAYDTFIVNLPGFGKQQLKVQLTTGRQLRVRGERPKEKDKWSRFCLERPIASHYDINEITAKLENNKLYIKHPKVNKPAAEAPKTESEINQKPQNKGQEKASEEVHPTTKNDAESVPGKSLEKKNGEVGGATTEKKKNDAGEKMENKVAAETSNGRDKSEVVEYSKKGFGVLLREMKHSRKTMILIVAILFVMVIVIYARNLVRFIDICSFGSFGKSQE